MERDSLLAHGAAYLLHDRLHACSDYHTMDVCTRWVWVASGFWVAPRYLGIFSLHGKGRFGVWA
jgi:DNA-directed RNA polymerase beta subunit